MLLKSAVLAISTVGTTFSRASGVLTYDLQASAIYSFVASFLKITKRSKYYYNL